jgi:hypothetical protein
MYLAIVASGDYSIAIGQKFGTDRTEATNYATVGIGYLGMLASFF